MIYIQTINLVYISMKSFFPFQNSVLRLTTKFVEHAGEESDDYPLEIVVRQQRTVQSWNLPLEMTHG